MKSDDSRQIHSDKTIFKMASVRHLEFSKSDIHVCRTVIMLLSTKLRINWTTKFLIISLQRFSIWRLSAILNLQNYTIFSLGRPWKQTLRQHTKFHWNLMTRGWNILIKPFSKWRPSAILNFRILIFWSRYLCANLILLLTKFCVNQTISRWYIAKRPSWPSDVCLSVGTSSLSREHAERPRKTKIGTEVAHVTHDSDTTFKVRRSTC